MEYKTALKLGLYDYENARNWYRTVSSPDNGGSVMHRDLVFQWIRNNALLIAPFTPHFSEHVWQNVLGERSSVQTAPFPVTTGDIDSATLQQLEYMRGVVDSIRSAESIAARKKGGKGKETTNFDPSQPKHARIYVASDFPSWQKDAIAVVKASWDDQKQSFDDGKMRADFTAAGMIKDKRIMPFSQGIKVSSSE